MGGYGSGRWGLHTKKIAVESCGQMRIKDVGPIVKAARAIRLTYTLTPRRGDPETLDYPVSLTWTPTPWGARRWWFTCPLVINGRPCGRRAAVLYLPPGGRFYGCRRCYGLTYKTSQESHNMDSVYRMFARLSGKSPDEMRASFEALEYLSSGKPSPWMIKNMGRILEAQQAAQAAELARLVEKLDNFDPYGHYLTPGDLCEQSGLTPDSLAALESARLLVPDHGGKYRPKLAGWGRKLAYLLGEGWTLPELQAWARGRWAAPDPRRFPPDRAAWQAENVSKS